MDERPDGAWLGLEDVAEGPSGPWSVERYALAARHLGAFAGASLVDQPPPDVPWLVRGLIRARVESRLGEVARLAARRDDPLVRRYWRPVDVDRLVRLAAQRHGLLDALDRLPQVLQHGDAGRKNLFARRRRRAGRDETVAIDWAWLGLGALGEEAATPATSAVLWYQADEADASALDQACLDGYVQGLRDAGWVGNARDVRLGMTAALALRYAFVPSSSSGPGTLAGGGSRIGALDGGDAGTRGVCPQMGLGPR